MSMNNTIESMSPNTDDAVVVNDPEEEIVEIGLGSKDFKEKSQQQHIYETPDMYVGGDGEVERTSFLFDIEQKKIYEDTIRLPPAVVQMFLEILTNAADGNNRTRRYGYAPGPIKIRMSKRWIEVRNDGLPIPIELTTNKDMYIPQKVFGTLLTSSNYVEERHEAGRNGIGGNVVNILSKKFVVTIVDTIRGKKYKQTWYNNMREMDEPIIEDVESTGTPEGSSVTVKYLMDFERFGYDPKQGYPEEAAPLFARQVLDVGFTCKSKVIFNDVDISYPYIKDYGRLYYGDAVDKASIIHYQTNDPEVITIEKEGEMQLSDPNHIPYLEVLIVDAGGSGNGKVISFVSSVMTTEGGAHVKAVMDKVVPVIVKEVNERGASSSRRKITKGSAKIRAAMEAKRKEESKKSRKFKISRAEVISRLSMIISCRLKNTRFSSQSKTHLDSSNPPLYVKISKNNIEKMFTWNLMEYLRAALKSIQAVSLGKTDGKKKRHVAIRNSLDANEAGGPNSNKCCGWVVEGMSAGGYATDLLSLIKNGRNIIGVYYLRGKLRNVSKVEDEEVVANNKIITGLKEFFGLVTNMDYRDPDNFNTLRYGSMMMMTDADSDGHHIKGLVMNYLNKYHHTLLEIGYVKDYRSPWLRLTKGPNVVKFYTISEFNRWCANNNIKGWHAKYFKGLGTSNEEDVKDDYKDFKSIIYYYDDHANDSFNLAFGKSNADDRKAWIEYWRRCKDKHFDLGEYMNISTFVRRELIEYVMHSLERAIPRFADGLKRSQGQLMWAAYKKWKLQPNVKVMKVVNFASYASTVTRYHHGDSSIAQTLMAMARDYVGSNNMEYFFPDGQFGTRMCGGADASNPRYPNTKPSWWVKFVFKDEDIPLLTLRRDEDEEVDPKFFLPIIPMHLVNGADGVATGHSTDIPNHHPVDVVDWLVSRIDDEECEPIKPWYRGFTGNIDIVQESKKKHNRTTPEYFHDPVGEEDGPGGINILDDSSDEEEKTDVRVEIDDPVEPDDYDSNDDNVEIDFESIDSINSSKNGYFKAIVEGNYVMKPNGDVIITELPVGRWTIVYKNWLDTMKADKRLRSYIDLSNKYKVHFTIKGFKYNNMSTLGKELGLVKSIRMSNMLLLDEDGTPRYFDNVTDILESFYKFRLKYYVKRKEYMLNDKIAKLQDMEYKLQFIKSVAYRELEVRNRPVKDIIVDMNKLGIPEEYLTKKGIKIYSCTKDKIPDLIKKIDAMKDDYDELESMSPKDLWRDDLMTFRDAYTRHEKKSQ